MPKAGGGPLVLYSNNVHNVDVVDVFQLSLRVESSNASNGISCSVGQHTQRSVKTNNLPRHAETLLRLLSRNLTNLRLHHISFVSRLLVCAVCLVLFPMAQSRVSQQE